MKGKLILKLTIPVEVDTDHYDCSTLSGVAEVMEANPELIHDLIEQAIGDTNMSELLTEIEVSNEPV
jgi:hypothetical protein